MNYNEIERLQQLAGILTEIKVNNPIMPYNLKELQDFYDDSEWENPNKEQQQYAEKELIRLGIFKDDTQELNYNQTHPLLKQLIDWAEEERT